MNDDPAVGMAVESVDAVDVKTQNTIAAVRAAEDEMLQARSGEEHAWFVLEQLITGEAAPEPEAFAASQVEYGLAQGRMSTARVRLYHAYAMALEVLTEVEPELEDEPNAVRVPRKPRAKAGAGDEGVPA